MKLSSKVVGIVAGNRTSAAAKAKIGFPVQVTPEPENPHDSNALAVYVYVEGIQHKVGYIPRASAERIEVPAEGAAGVVTSLRTPPDEERIVGMDVVFEGSLKNSTAEV